MRTDHVIRFPNNSMVDHVAWAVPDTVAGCEAIADLTGVKPYLMAEPEPGAYYWSGGLNLGDGQFLEVVGPNPAFEGFHPLLGLLRSIPEPRLLFWYVHIADIETFADAALHAGRPLTEIETMDNGDTAASSYRRCSLSGPIDPVVPNIISWQRRRREFTGPSTGATLAAFRTSHPDAQSLNALFEALGIEQHVELAEAATLEVDLHTPKGLVTLRGVGNPAAGFTLPPASPRS
jgi:Glyoxalase-like domain